MAITKLQLVKRTAQSICEDDTNSHETVILDSKSCTADTNDDITYEGGRSVHL